MSEAILEELSAAKHERLAREQNSAGARRAILAQRATEVADLRKSVVVPGLEAIDKIDGLMRIIGIGPANSFVRDSSYQTTDLEEYLTDKREQGYPFDTVATVKQESAIVLLGELPAVEGGESGLAAAQLFTTHTQRHEGKLVKDSFLKSRREYDVTTSEPEIELVTMQVSSLGGEEDGDLLDLTLPARNYRTADESDNDWLDNWDREADISEHQPAIVAMSSVLTLIEQRRVDPSNLLVRTLQ